MKKITAIKYMRNRDKPINYYIIYNQKHNYIIFW